MRRLLIMALCLLMTACASSKKSSGSSSVHLSDSSSMVLQSHTITNVSESESDGEYTSVTVTEITFFDNPQQLATSDTTANNIANDESSFTITTNGDITGSSSNIKSIKQTTYVSESQHKNETNQISESDTIASMAQKSTIDADSVTVTEKKNNSMQSKIVFAASLLVLFFVVFARKPILRFVKKVMIGIVRTISQS